MCKGDEHVQTKHLHHLPGIACSCAGSLQHAARCCTAQCNEEWFKSYETYLADLTAQLDGLLPSAYTPGLTLIDELVKSIEVGAAPASALTGGQMANPASANYVKQGGTLTIQKRGDGGEYGICLFEDNRQCEE